MAYVPVPKDLTKVKPKVAFGLTKRQLICFSAAAAVGLPVYFFTRKLLGQSTAAMLMVLLVLPFFLLAMYSRDGLPLEAILQNVIRTKLLYPAERPYQVTNLYAPLDDNLKPDKEVSPRAKSSRKRKPRTAHR